VGGAKYWDSIAPVYEELYASPWSQFEDSTTKDALRVELSRGPGYRVLDVGCGSGLGYELLLNIDPTIFYIATDVSECMLRLFEEKHPGVPRLLASGDKIGELFLDASFDLVIALNVSASFPTNTEAMIGGIYNVLRPSGRFYISFLNRFSLRRLLRMRFRRRERYRTRGDEANVSFALAHTYTGRELRAQFTRAGLREIKVGYQSVLGGVWESGSIIWLERILSTLAPWLGHSVILCGER
jgi:SAM-dependent methyltransferase